MFLLKLLILSVAFIAFDIELKAQDYETDFNKQIIKNKVKTLTVYRFQTPKDSLKMRLETFDSVGNKITQNLFGNLGEIFGTDSFFYDKNSLLKRQVNYYQTKKMNEVVSIYDKYGKIIEQRMFILDSLDLRTIFSYDGTKLTKSVCNQRNSTFFMIFNNFYDKDGFLTKRSATSSSDTIFDKNGFLAKRNATRSIDTSFLFYKYNNLKKIKKLKIIKTLSETISRYKYSNGNLREIRSVTTSVDKKLVYKLQFTYLSSGLLNERKHYTDGNVEIHKTYYTFY